MICPLCLSKEHFLFDQDKLRTYELCSTCQLVYVPRNLLISENSEKERYEAHENMASDEGYRQYLKKIADAVLKELKPESVGLDFGCGKTTLLAELCAPFEVFSFDLFFHNDPELLKETYDFIILSEVIEHLRSPREIMLELKHLLRPGGRIFIKTKLRPELSRDFSQWFYKRDTTHIQFFNEDSFHTLKGICNFQSWTEIGEDLFVLA